MYRLVLFFFLVGSALAAGAGERVAVGDWTLLKGTMTMGENSVEMTQKYAIVGQEEDTDGTLLLWFETEISTAGNRRLMKILVPAITFEQEDVTSAAFYQKVRRWIVKMGEQPAMEVPPEQARQQVQFQFGSQDPDVEVEELGEEMLETPRGELKCAKKRYQGRKIMQPPRAPMPVTLTNIYDRTTWHTDVVPIIGYARLEESGRMEFSGSGPGASSPPPRKMFTQIELVDYGQGAESALTEEPMPAGMPPAAVPE